MNTPTFNRDLMECLQMFAQPTSIGRLVIRNSYAQGSIYVFEGIITHAEVDGLEGLAACHHLLSWNQAEIAWEEGVTPPASTMKTPPDLLLTGFLSGNPDAAAPATASASLEVLLIQVLAGPFDGQVFEISQPTVQIGSDSQCEICLPDATVSRVHCQIRQVGRQFSAEDLNSTNGSWLNGQPFHSGAIQSGDVLQLGQTQLRIEVALKRPVAASTARQTMRIGRPSAASLPFPTKSGPIHWKDETQADAKAKKQTGKGLWQRLLKA